MVKKLEDAHKFALKNADSNDNSQKLKTWEKSFIIICSVIIALAVSFDVFVGVWQIKISKKKNQDVKKEKTDSAAKE